MKRLGLAVLAVLLAGSVLGLPACHKDTAPTPIATPTPIPPPVRGVIAQFGFGQFPSGVYVGVPLPLSQGGILDVTVDWTFPDTFMFLYIAKGTCDFTQLSTNTCPYVVKSETQSPKPRFLQTPPIPAGTYSLIFYNVAKAKKSTIGSDNTESISCQIGLTVGVPGVTALHELHDLKPVVIRP